MTFGLWSEFTSQQSRRAVWVGEAWTDEAADDASLEPPQARVVSARPDPLQGVPEALRR